jgi:outer membrane protein OmpA-like peptidoglycan-associated protein
VIDGRRFHAWLTIAAVSIGTACGPKPISSPANPAQDLVVLLPDPGTTTVGAAGVSNQLGSVDLAASHDAVIVKPNSPPVLTKLSPDEVQRLFGDALSALPPAPRRFTLFFRFESDELTEQSQALIPEVLSAVKEFVFQDVVVIGHTDTMGTQQANYGLGLKRAMTVRNILVSAGLSAATIEVTSVGELDPVVKTPDETPEPRNRRVEISVR